MSMLEDIQRGSSMELDLLFAMLRSVTDSTVIQAPTLETVCTLARLRLASDTPVRAAGGERR